MANLDIGLQEHPLSRSIKSMQCFLHLIKNIRHSDVSIKSPLTVYSMLHTYTRPDCTDFWPKWSWQFQYAKKQFWRTYHNHTKCMYEITVARSKTQLLDHFRPFKPHYYPHLEVSCPCYSTYTSHWYVMIRSLAASSNFMNFTSVWRK